MEKLFKTPWKEKIQEKLPKLFRIAEIECSKAGKIGMEVGSLREQVLIALLICIYGQKSVDKEVPITTSGRDVILKGERISIKTVTGNGKVKAVWTVDQKSAKTFKDTYKPDDNILLARTFWGKTKSSLFYIPLEVQQEIFSVMGTEKYLDLPKPDTNPRGVEFSPLAMKSLENHPKTTRMEINWKHQDITINIYKRWMDYWLE